MADRMRRRGEEHVHVVATLVDPITVSIGVAPLDPRSTESHLAVVKAADAAIRGAKTSGKNRVTLALPAATGDGR